MSKRTRYPVLMTARFASTCPETGKAIAKGETVAYFPDKRVAYHYESKAAEGLRAQEFASAYGMADANY